MTLLKNLPIIILATVLSSCGSTNKTTSTYWVNSSKVDCDAGAGKTTCLQVTKADAYDNAEWSNFYSKINGFTFEPGYLQKIEVTETALNSENVPADAASIQYDLVNVIEKKQDPKLAIHDIWAATHINGDPIEITNNNNNNNNIPTLEINTTEMRAFGTNGCNSYSGQIKNITSDAIEFGAMASTRKMCMDMEIPDRFDKAFNSISSYKKEGLTLSFFNETGDEVLRFKKVD
ncbi:DUF4377 domain-containing protein [Winogradskyella psychrotolerans]|uniref:DUF4377 domain-containing protein n=1 Tax=Winogradskyella psychrotolerans TaxID=1344585 RepID=UPI001C07CFD0|nr:DUF4377 domain-containing protein [Winogradskyella psychrotolerans]MBU2928520.1 DUF4377 domain-containing protein [Winogradskyella psychrotolerans]